MQLHAIWSAKVRSTRCFWTSRQGWSWRLWSTGDCWMQKPAAGKSQTTSVQLTHSSPYTGIFFHVKVLRILIFFMTLLWKRPWERLFLNDSLGFCGSLWFKAWKNTFVVTLSSTGLTGWMFLFPNSLTISGSGSSSSSARSLPPKQHWSLGWKRWLMMGWWFLPLQHPLLSEAHQSHVGWRTEL